MDRPVYALAAAPSEPVVLRDFFESGPNSIMTLLEHPPAFRSSGWDLSTATTPRIAGGEYLEAASGDEKIVRLYEDGTLLARAAADTFLAWPLSREQFHQNPRLNTLAIVEFTTAFVYFYRRLLGKFDAPPSSIKFQITFQNADLGGKKIYVRPYPVLSTGWQFDIEDDDGPIEKPNMQRDIAILASEVAEDPNAAAYTLVKELFLFFCIPPNKLPYVKEGDPRRIDITSFSKR
jgi:hypothetical protein